MSYNRPLTTGNNSSRNEPLYAEYPMIRFLEKNGYDVSYFTDVDTARSAAEILNHKTFMSVGHDEYWSAEQRNNTVAARNAGVNLAFFSANEIFWKTRFAASISTGAQAWRTVVCYKESKETTKIDPADPPTLEDVRAFCEGRLAHYKVPSRLQILDSLTERARHRLTLARQGARIGFRRRYGGRLCRRGSARDSLFVFGFRARRRQTAPPASVWRGHTRRPHSRQRSANRASVSQAN